MSFRIKYRIVLLITIIFALLYLIAHFHLADRWIIEKTIYFTKTGHKNESINRDFVDINDNIADGTLPENTGLDGSKYATAEFPLNDHQELNGRISIPNERFNEYRIHGRQSTPSPAPNVDSKAVSQYRFIETTNTENYQNISKTSDDIMYDEAEDNEINGQSSNTSFKTKKEENHGEVGDSSDVPVRMNDTSLSHANVTDQSDIVDDDLDSSSTMEDSKGIMQQKQQQQQQQQEHLHAPNIVKDSASRVMLPVVETLPRSFQEPPQFVQSTLSTATTENKNITNDDDVGNACSYMSGISNAVSSAESQCQLYSNHFDACTDASTYYNKETFKTIPKCKQKKYPPICHFTTASRADDGTLSKLVCNNKICRNNKLTVGVLDPMNGKMKHLILNNMTSLKNVLDRVDVDFVFLSCKKGNRKIHQLLQFPPKIVSRSKRSIKLNINVFVIDSISRQHFYRILPNTVNAMKTINIDKSHPTMLFDFEAFQSLAPFTYINLQAFLTGNVGYESVTNRRYSIEDIFQKFKNAGYQTLLQEDTCWYDVWGSLLTGNRKLKGTSKAYHQKIWKEINNITEYYGVDSLGLTHMSCEVLSKYGDTNLFSSNNMVCLNGKPLSTYFIDYLANDIKVRSRNQNAKPLLSYTHINFAHEPSGVRLKAIDEDIAKFIKLLGSQSDTLTILWSDHGGKTNQYSMDTLTGRFEVYDPFLFMIVPKTFSSMVGQDNFQNMVANQNALLTAVDLRHTLVQILDKVDRTSSTSIDTNKDSLFSNSLHERSHCQLSPGRKYALCKCINKLSFPNMSDRRYMDFVTWLGEFAIGYLNNKLISEQITSKGGYKCQRFIASSIDKVVIKDIEFGNVYIFDIVLKNLAENDLERFNIHILYNMKRNETLPMLSVEFSQRVSVYNKFKSCKDDNVSIEMCICSDESEVTGTQNYLRTYEQFGVIGGSEPIQNNTCLLLITRNHGIIVTFEVANLCKKQMKIAFSTNVLYSWEVAENLPLEITIGSGKIMYITSFYKIYAGDEDIQTNIEIK